MEVLREVAFHGVPVVNVGTLQLNREHGNIVLHVPYDANDIESAIKNNLIMEDTRDHRYMVRVNQVNKLQVSYTK
jgi:hypothetical protein|tara:strand:+ start:175 stop:399 length:225 start_codon:yes stop_codon:yes gene_type:complete